MGRGPHTDEETRSRPLGLRKRSPVSTVLRYLAPTPTTTPGTTVSQLQFRDESHLRVKVPPWTGPDLETFGPPGYVSVLVHSSVTYPLRRERIPDLVQGGCFK